MKRIYISLILSALPCYAAANDTNIDLGGLVLVNPNYVGSDSSQARVLPYIGFENLYGFDMAGLAVSRKVLDAGTGKGPGKWSLEAGPKLSFDFGRDSSDSPTLEGLDDVDSSLILGGYANATIGILGVRMNVGQDVIGGHDGLVADFAVGTRYPGKGWYVSPFVSLSWADASYTQTTYGITEAQDVTSNLSQFNTKSGFHKASASVLGGFALDENWNVTALVSYSKTLGDYRDSPILKAEDGSSSGLFTTLAISRRFSF